MKLENGEFWPTSYADLQVMADPNTRTKERKERRSREAELSPTLARSAEPRIVRSGYGERAQIPQDVARLMGLHQTTGTGASFRGWESSASVRKLS